MQHRIVVTKTNGRQTTIQSSLTLKEIIDLYAKCEWQLATAVEIDAVSLPFTAHK